MKKLSLNLTMLVLVFLMGPMAAQAEMGWNKFKPGLVSSAISNDETVLLGYLSTW